MYPLGVVPDRSGDVVLVSTGGYSDEDNLDIVRVDTGLLRNILLHMQIFAHPYWSQVLPNPVTA